MRLLIVGMSLYLLVAAVSFIMAWKCLATPAYMAFHEKAAQRKWDEVEERLQEVILAIQRVAGLGFGVVGMLLLLAVVGLFLTADPLVRFALPALGLGYCCGLAGVNAILTRRTFSGTPWKKSLVAAVLLAGGMLCVGLAGPGSLW